MITVSFLKNLNVKKYKSYFYKKSLLSLSREEYDICLLLIFFLFWISSSICYDLLDMLCGSCILAILSRCSEDCSFGQPCHIGMPCLKLFWQGTSDHLEMTSHILADTICPALLETIIKGTLCIVVLSSCFWKCLEGDFLVESLHTWDSALWWRWRSITWFVCMQLYVYSPLSLQFPSKIKQSKLVTGWFEVWEFHLWSVLHLWTLSIPMSLVLLLGQRSCY